MVQGDDHSAIVKFTSFFPEIPKAIVGLHWTRRGGSTRRYQTVQTAKSSARTPPGLMPRPIIGTVRNPIVIDNDHNNSDLTDRSDYTLYQTTVDDSRLAGENADRDAGDVAHIDEGVAAIVARGMRNRGGCQGQTLAVIFHQDCPRALPLGIPLFLKPHIIAENTQKAHLMSTSEEASRCLISLALTFCLKSQTAVWLTKRIPSRLRAEEAPRSAFGLVRADKLSSRASAHGIDIIFVHGLGLNPDTTWGPRDGQCWVSDFLPQDISEDISTSFHKDIRFFFYNYDSYWKRDAVQARLWSLGKSLLDHITSKIRGTEEEQTRHLVFVGHSYRGLVIKRGSIAARALQPLGSNPSLLQEVAYDSLPLQDLHEEFENAIRDKLRVINFYEQRKTRVLKVWFIQWEEWCVREQSATYSKVDKIGLPVDHYGLNKFGLRDENYEMIFRKLLKTIRSIALQKQRRLYSVPISTIESYMERPRLLAAVNKKLRVSHQKARVPHALTIYGLGGTGD
ncbi:hypothetical protein GJ744_004800 [Endocarpon pusillum]|uniref:DUF676 domain-containing protein n=1 Tax=Endocarpon pusillum TaxID=364733 RepID=A0A8H7A8I3_9EURO|nr:hypothetical protein GJ744_004800 [Endocarpon pusillum]